MICLWVRACVLSVVWTWNILKMCLLQMCSRLLCKLWKIVQHDLLDYWIYSVRFGLYVHVDVDHENIPSQTCVAACRSASVCVHHVLYMHYIWPALVSCSTFKMYASHASAWYDAMNLRENKCKKKQALVPIAPFQFVLLPFFNSAFQMICGWII